MSTQEIELIVQQSKDSTYENPAFVSETYDNNAEKRSEEEQEPQPSTSAAAQTLNHPIEMELIPFPIEEEQQETHNSKNSFEFIGITFTILYAVFHCLVILFIKLLLLRNYSPILLTVYRQIGSLIPTVYFLISALHYQNDQGIMQKQEKHFIWKNVYPIRQHRKNCIAITVAGLLSTIGMILRFYAYSNLMITDAVAANYLFMVFLFLFGWIILKTQFSFSIIHSSCSVLIVIGIVILIQPFKGITSITGYDTTQLVGIGFKVADTLFAAMFTILIKKIHFIHFLIINCSCGFIGISIGLIGSILSNTFQIPTDTYDVGLFILIPIGTTMAYLLFSLAIRYEQHGLITCCRTFDMIFSIILQVVFLNIWPDFWTILACIIIAFGVILIGVRKCLLDLPMESNVRKKCQVLLK